jgi:hypothetical protein
MENLEWKQISDLNYEASSNGDIRNKKTSRILKQHISIHGYMLVDIQINKKGKTFAVHKLIAKAFLDEINYKNEIDHINRIKTDNRVCNLRRVDRKENNENRGKYNKISNKQIRLVINLFKSGKSVDEICILLND